MIDNLALVIANRVGTTLEHLGEKDDAKLLMVEDLEQALGGLELAEVRGQAESLNGVFAELEREHEELFAPEGAAGTARANAQMRTLNIAGLVSPLTSAFMLLPQLPKAVGMVADVLGYFRSNYKITGREVSVSERALLCSAAGLLRGRDVTAFLPGSHAAGESEILDDLKGLAQKAARLKTGRDFLAAELPEEEQNGGGGEPAGDPQNGQRLARVAAAVRETDAALLTYEGFRTAWTTPPEGEEQTTLGRALLREGIEKLEQFGRS